MADVDATRRAEALLEAAREANIKLPKGKKQGISEASAAVEAAGGGKGGAFDKKAALKILKDKFGKNPKSGKRKAGEAPDGEGKGAAKRASSSVLDEVWSASSKEERKGNASKLVAVARSRGVKMSEDEASARMAAGRAMMAEQGDDGTFKVKSVVEALEGNFGKDPSWVDPDDSAPKKKAKTKPSTAKKCVCPENAGLADAFDEIAGLCFKEQKKVGSVYKKVMTAIKNLEHPMVTPPKKGEIAGVGPKSILMMKEFLETGKMTKLEEMRENDAA